jgi:stage V sporulation protein G
MPKAKSKNPFQVARITLTPKDSLKAIAVVKVHDLIFLTGIRIIEGKNGLFVSMPNRKTFQGEYEDIFFASSRENRESLSTTVLEAYAALSLSQVKQGGRHVESSHQCDA